MQCNAVQDSKNKIKEREIGKRTTENQTLCAYKVSLELPKTTPRILHKSYYDEENIFFS